MQRSFRLSTVVFAVMLSPALFQTGLNCDVGSAELASLELQARGLERVEFESGRFLYDVLVEGAAEMTLHAYSVDPDASVGWIYGDDSGQLGPGGGVVTLPVQPEASVLVIEVGPRSAFGREYKLSIDPRPRRWSVPERVGGNTLNVRYAQVEFDLDGNALVVWREDDGVSFNVGANRFTPAGGWSGPERISLDDGAEDFEEPHFGFDGSGNAIAVWRQHRHVLSSRFTRTDGWSIPERIDVGVPLLETTVNGQPQVAMHRDGTANAVWRAIWTPTDDQIWGNRFTPEDGWSPPERVEPYANEKSTPRVATTPDGGALAVWQSGADSFAQLSSARFTLDDGWTNAGSVGRGRWSFPPWLIHNDAGDIMYVFLGDGSFGKHDARRYDIDDGWAPVTEEPGPRGGYISAGIDSNGAALIAWQDVVAPSTWGALAIRSTLGEGFGDPVEIGDPVLGGAHSPDLAVHPDGHAIAVFRQPDGTGESVWFNRFTPALGWETPAPLEHREAEVAATPRVAIDPAGNAIAVWEESDASGNKSLWASRYALPSGPDTRSEPEVIDGDARSSDPRVAVNDSGLAIVVWDSEDGMTARFRRGAGDWGYARIIQDDTGNAQFPIVGLDDDDRATVIWQQAPHAGVYHARYSPELDWEPAGPIDSVDSSFENLGALGVSPGGDAVALWRSDGVLEGSTLEPALGWSPTATLSDPGGFDAFNPAAFLGPNGDGFALWTVVASSLWSRRYLPSVGFAEPELITDTVVGNGNSAEVAVAPDGSAIAVWHRYYGGYGNIWHSHYDVGGGWSPPEELDQTDDRLLFDPRIGMDAQGNAIVVWRQAADDFFDIWSRVYSATLGWGEAELIELATGQSEEPALAVSSTGHAVVVWALGRDAQPGIDLDVWANRYTPGQGWGVSQRIEYIFRNVAWGPDVGIAGDGTAVVTWGDGTDIWTRVLAP